MIESTLKVDPPPELPPPRGSLLGALVLLAALVVLLVSVSTLGGLLGESLAESQQRLAWQLGGSLGAAWLLPLVVAFWLRRRGGKKRLHPSGAALVLLANLLLLGALVLLIPLQTRTALERRGHWWVEVSVRALGVKGESVVIDTSRALTRKLAHLLPLPPAEQPAVRSPRPTTRPAAAAAPDAALPARDRGVDRGVLVARDGGRQEVRFQRGGRGIVVPVRLRGPSGSIDVKMLFDTGASLSSIDSRTLSRLGINLTSSEPTITTLTANGPAQRTLLVLEGAAIGLARVGGGLSATLCDPCAHGDVVGLLGLNFSRHFTVTVDHEAGRLTLAPKAKDPGALYDIRGFVSFDGGRGLLTGGRFEVRTKLHNRSAYALRDLRVEARFSDGRKLSSPSLPRVEARGTLETRFEGKLPGRAGSFSLHLVAGAWDLR